MHFLTDRYTRSTILCLHIKQTLEEHFRARINTEGMGIELEGEKSEIIVIFQQVNWWSQRESNPCLRRERPAS